MTRYPIRCTAIVASRPWRLSMAAAFAGLIAASLCLVTGDGPTIGASPLRPAAKSSAFEWRAQLGGHASAVGLHGEHVLLAMGGRLVVLRAVSAAAPQIVSETEPIAGQIADIAVHEGHAFVVDPTFGVHIVDVQEPSNPTVVGALAIDGSPRRIRMADGLMYVAAGDNGLVIVDVSEPGQPSMVGHLASTRIVRDVELNDSVAYLAESDNWEAVVRTIDISDPASPRELSFVDTPGGADELAATDRFLYVVSVTTRIWVLDITADPAVPSRAGMTSLSTEMPSQPGLPNTSPPALGITLVDDYAYVTRGEGGLNVLDMRFPLRPLVVNTLDTPGQATDIVIRGRRGTAYLADGTGGLRVIDLRNRPEEIVETSAVGSPGDVRDIAVFKDYAAIVDASHGVRMIDLADPDHPVLRGDVKTTGLPRAVGVRVDRNPGSRGHVMVGEKPNVRYVRVGDHLEPRYSGGLVEVNPSSLTSPKRMKEIDGPSVVDLIGTDRNVWTLTDRVAVAPGGTAPNVGLTVFDQELSQVGALALPCGLRQMAMYRRVYVTCELLGLKVISGTAEAPELLASVALPGRTGAVAADDEVIVAGNDSGLVSVLDAGAPVTPTVIGTIDLGAAVRALAMVDASVGPSYAVVATADSLISLVELTDASAPLRVDSYRVPGGSAAHAVAVVGDRVYVGAPGTVVVLGIVEIDVTPTPSPTQTPSDTPVPPTPTATVTPGGIPPRVVLLPVAYR